MSSYTSYPSSSDDSLAALTASSASSVSSSPAVVTPRPRASSPGEKPRVLICLLRLDLRINDNALFHFAHMTAPPPLQPAHFNQQANLDALHSQADYLLPLYVFDERNIELSGLPGYQRRGLEARTPHYGFWKTGVAPARFICESVYDLRSHLRDVGSDLMIRFGFPEEVVAKTVAALQVDGYEVEGVWMQKEMSYDEAKVEKEIEGKLSGTGVPVRYVHGKTVVHPADLPFEVSQTPDIFTPFRKQVEALGPAMVRPCFKAPQRFKPIPPSLPKTSDYALDITLELDVAGSNAVTSSTQTGVSFLDILRYLLAPISSPDHLVSDATLQQRHAASAFPMRGGETAALERLEWYFISGKTVDASPPVARYKQTRNNLVGHAYSTKMSPFLAYGCISPRQIWEALDRHDYVAGGEDRNTHWVRFELLWRDYFFWASEKFGRLLFTLGGFEEATNPAQAKIKTQTGWWKTWDPQSDGREHPVSRLLEGRTGIPFIDANILELRQTGYVSNRGRQNVASFLTKDLGFDWLLGAEFFQSHLIDYDATNNYGNWQYVAGVGNDPRATRQFNVCSQAKSYDTHGEYVKLWIPALRNLHPDHVHTPWLLSVDERRKYGLKLSEMDVSNDTYPGTPMFENEAWRKHYDRKEGVGSKMFGNPQERVKDKTMRGGAAKRMARGAAVARTVTAAPPPLKLVPRQMAPAGAQPDVFADVGRGFGVRSAQRPSSSGASGLSAPAPRPTMGRTTSLPRPPIARPPGLLPTHPPAAAVPTGMPGHALPPQPPPSHYARQQPQQTHRTSRSFSEAKSQQLEQEQSAKPADQLSWRRGGAKPSR